MMSLLLQSLGFASKGIHLYTHHGRLSVEAIGFMRVHVSSAGPYFAAKVHWVVKTGRG